MSKQPHWFDAYHAGDFFADLVEIAIEVSKLPKTPEKPPKPRANPSPDKPKK